MVASKSLLKHLTVMPRLHKMVLSIAVLMAGGGTAGQIADYLSSHAGTAGQAAPTTAETRNMLVAQGSDAQPAAAPQPDRTVSQRVSPWAQRMGFGFIAGGFVKDSVLGRNVFVDAGAEVKESILFDNVYVGRGARIHRGIIDKNVRVAPGDHIGHDLARDALRHTVSEGGVTVVQKARDTLLTRSRNF